MKGKVGNFFREHMIPNWPIIPKSLRVERDKDEPRTVNIFLGFFFMVNFILGTGFLGIPYGFFHGGLIPGTLTLIVTGIMSWQCALFELEAMARAQTLTIYRDSEDFSEKETDDEVPTKPDFHISIYRKFEPSELCHVFIGLWLKVIYIVLLTVHSFLALLSYSTVTGTAWSVNLPLNFSTLEQCTDKDFFHQLLPFDGCLNAYRFSLFLFAVVVIPLSLLDLKEQAIVQFLLGVLRFVTLGGIILYCFVYLVQGFVLNDCHDTVAVHTSDILNSSLTSMKDIAFHFDFNGWVVAIPVFVYALSLHQGIPGLTHPIKEKNWLRGLFNVLYIVVILIYTVLGILVALWFRDCTNENCTLNWHPLTSSEHSTAVRVLAYYIILFPSIDICSVFPLVIHVIVNNIYTVVLGRDTSQVSGWKHCLVQIGMKLVAGLAPISLAMFISNLVYILKYAGLIGFFITFFSPVVFQLSSSWVCYNTFSYMVVDDVKKVADSSIKLQPIINGKQEDKLLLDDTQTKSFTKTLFNFLFTCRNNELYKTPYSTILSHPLCVIALFLLAVMWFILTVVSLFVHPT